MSIEKLLKILNEYGWIKIKNKTIRRLANLEIEDQDFDSKINDLIDCVDFLIDNRNKKK